MKKYLTLLFLLICSFWTAKAQINIEDSSVQVISYWDMGDRIRYNVIHESIKLSNGDTISKSEYSYDVIVSVIDSSDKHYTITWDYENFQLDDLDQSTNKWINKMLNKLTVIYKTDELGIVEDVENIEEIQKNSKKIIKKLTKKLTKGNKELRVYLKSMEESLTTKEGIITSGIKDIQQFHYFHGVMMEMGETYTHPYQSNHVYAPDELLDGEISYGLIEINSGDLYYDAKAEEAIDSLQLTKLVMEITGDLIKSMGEDVDDVNLVALQNEIGTLRNNTTTYSRIHNTGWPLLSLQQTDVSTLEHRRLNIRVISFEEYIED